MAPWSRRGKNTEGPSEKLGLSLDCGLTVNGLMSTDTKKNQPCSTSTGEGQKFVTATRALGPTGGPTADEEFLGITRNSQEFLGILKMS